MRSNETIIKYYQAECALKHKHRIEVSYNSEQETFEISKEMPATKEEIEEAEREIMEILKETCNFCDKQVERMELAGFRHPSGMPFKDQSPICQDCWKKHELENDDKYSSLERYWIVVGVKGEEELRNCPALTGYPKTGKISKGEVIPDNLLNDFDLEQLNKFKNEVDIKGFQKRKQTYGEISDEQKLFVLEHLCWLRDQELRESREWEEFQRVIERVRDIYRWEADGNPPETLIVRRKKGLIYEKQKEKIKEE